MEWINPKTDWAGSEDERFEYSDYNRIIGNIAFLKSLADELFNGLSAISYLPQKEILQLFYAREMNEIENNLDKINVETYGFEIGEKKIYKANGNTPLWSEFNRIESASLLLYNTMMAHKKALSRLSVVLGGQKGFRV